MRDAAEVRERRRQVRGLLLIVVVGMGQVFPAGWWRLW